MLKSATGGPQEISLSWLAPGDTEKQRVLLDEASDLLVGTEEIR